MNNRRLEGQGFTRCPLKGTDSRHTCAALSGLFRDRHLFPGLTPWALVVSPLRGLVSIAAKRRDRKAQGVSPGNERPSDHSPEKAAHLWLVDSVYIATLFFA